jgi:hypothetical protein
VHRLKTVVWRRALIIAAGTGAVYGLLALEAVSPLAIVLLLWVLGILVLAWRVPLQMLVVAASASGFVFGFGILWAVVLSQQLATCLAPSCTAADPVTDVLYALAFLAPVIGLAGGELALRKWLLGRRRSARG